MVRSLQNFDVDPLLINRTLQEDFSRLLGVQRQASQAQATPGIGGAGNSGNSVGQTGSGIVGIGIGIGNLQTFAPAVNALNTGFNPAQGFTQPAQQQLQQLMSAFIPMMMGMMQLMQSMFQMLQRLLPGKQGLGQPQGGGIPNPGTGGNPGGGINGPYGAGNPGGYAGGPGGTYNPGGQPGGPIPNNLDFRLLNEQQRTQLGLNDRDRAVLHLWGRQMIAEGRQNGAILNTVMDSLQNGGNNGSVVVRQAEAQLAQELIARDTARDGGITGRSLDEEFFRVYQKITGKDISQRYADRPIEYANGRRAQLPEHLGTDSLAWQQALERQNGLNRFENAVLRLWGHDPLFNGGRINGAILPYTLSSPNALDRGMNKDDVMALLRADLASDGVLNGDSLEGSFLDVVDKLYGRGGGTNADKVMNNALNQAARIGRSPMDVAQSLTQGVNDAMQQVMEQVRNHPVLTGMTVGGLMAATAVCPFLGGLGAGGIAMSFGRGPN